MARSELALEKDALLGSVEQDVLTSSELAEEWIEVMAPDDTDFTKGPKGEPLATGPKPFSLEGECMCVYVYVCVCACACACACVCVSLSKGAESEHRVAWVVLNNDRTEYQPSLCVCAYAEVKSSVLEAPEKEIPFPKCEVVKYGFVSLKRGIFQESTAICNLADDDRTQDCCSPALLLQDP
jgi:hypothetical protein